MASERHPNAPLEKKSDKTVTFIGPDGNELEVVSNISKAALAILKRQGFRKQSEVFKEQEEAAEEKAAEAEEAVDKKAPAKKAVSK